ncbi:rho GTPase-activating protein 28 [Enoplosus armatus]|uniref:rho GTPase-activating protein 28 n=1 Tax=Enoplosus armatus TaxID=215367 RepID=UPI00399509C2
MLSSPPTTSLPTSSAPPPPPQTVTSVSRHVTMETYWREVQSIEEEKEGEEEEEEEERKSMDEVELEEAWLTEAGLSSLVTGSLSEEASPPPAEALLSTLTRQQAATVRKRLDNYNETLKMRNRQPIRDVREIFTEPDDDSAERCPSPSSHRAESLPGRYNTTTKTIRRNTHRVRPTLPTFLFEDQLLEHPSSPTNTHCPSHTHSSTNTHCPTHTDSLTHTPSPPVSQWRQADWLLRDSPYSEGVAEHKRGGTCWDCLRFQGDDSGDLPFVPVDPSQGVSSANDLSSCDLTRLGFISHIELSTFLLALGIQTKRTRPPRRRTRDSGVFGVPLNSLLDNDRKKFPGVKVPVVFQKLLCILEQNGLQTEGILRVPGSAARLKYLRRELDRCCGGFDWSAVRQVDAAGLLKLFIRELPTPLLTHTHLSTYRSVLGISSVVHQVQALQLLLLLLPEANRDTLRALLVFLCKVVSRQDQNRMSLCNVSMVMAPNLFTSRHRGNKCSVAKQREEMEEAVGGAHLVRLMITHQDLLWTVPSFLLSQVRQMNQASNQKQLGLTKRLLRKKNDKNDRNQITELSEGVIRVHAPLHTKVSMAIQLDGQTRAKDVTARFECDNSPVQRLYEVGGNINERRLHPDCLLLDVYRVNPHCDWLIKP